MKHGFRSTIAFAVAFGATLTAPTALAYLPWTAVPDDELAELRGGFITPQGLHINFSLENVVMVNGELRAQTVLQFFGINPARPASGGGTPAATAPATANAVPPAPEPAPADPVPTATAAQDSVTTPVPVEVATPAPVEGNSVLNSGLHTVIQNSLDNQTIQSIKVINVEIANLRALQNVGLNNRVHTGLIEALR